MAKRRYEDDDDEDDRPRAKKRPVEEDEDDDDPPPRKKKRRADDDDDADIPAGTPRDYVCKDCGETTRMPAEEVVKYLENPFELGEADEAMTHCTGCDEDVPWKKCKWVETNQNCYEYLEDLRAEMLIRGDDPRPGPSLQWWLPIIAAVVLGLVVGGGGRKALGLGFVAGLVAAGVGLVVGAIWMFVQYNADKKASPEYDDKLLKRYYKRYPDRKPAPKKRRPRNDDDEDDD